MAHNRSFFLEGKPRAGRAGRAGRHLLFVVVFSLHAWWLFHPRLPGERWRAHDGRCRVFILLLLSRRGGWTGALLRVEHRDGAVRSCGFYHPGLGFGCLS